MSNPTYSSHAFKPLSKPAGTSLLAELFAATPLAIFLAALKTPQQPKR